MARARYRPPKYSQGDGSVYQWVNCVWASATVLIDRATVGALRIAAPVLRKASGDTSGGSTYNQAQQTTLVLTTKAGRPVNLRPRYDLGREQLRDLGRAGIAFAVTILCSVTVNTRFRTNYFTGRHSITVVDYDDTNNLFLVEDPGTTAAGYMWWPEDLLFRAAEANGGGVGRIHALLAPDTEGVKRVIAMNGRIRSQPSVDSTDKGPLTVGQTVTVSNTTNGGSWKRADGGVSDGWQHIGVGKWVAGERLKEAA